jgi:diamine N-acetyltransferase
MNVTLRRATPADIPFLMRAERGPGYDHLVGQSSAAEHEAMLSGSGSVTLIGMDGGTEAGFTILTGLTDRHSGICMKRIVAASAGSGFGTAMISAALDWIFANTSVHRVWLDTLCHNARAAHVYRKIGFVDEGVFRESYEMPDGSRADRMVLSILRPEWLSSPSGR